MSASPGSNWNETRVPQYYNAGIDPIETPSGLGSYIDASTVNISDFLERWKEYQKLGLGIAPTASGLPEQQWNNIVNVKKLVIAGIIKVPIYIECDSTIKDILEKTTISEDSPTDLRDIFTSPSCFIDLKSGPLYLHNLSNVSVSHRSEETGLRYESEPVAPTFDKDMLISFIDELDVEIKKALKEHLLSQVKF